MTTMSLHLSLPGIKSPEMSPVMSMLVKRGLVNFDGGMVSNTIDAYLQPTLPPVVDGHNDNTIYDELKERGNVQTERFLYNKCQRF